MENYDPAGIAEDYRLIEKAILYLEEAAPGDSSLAKGMEGLAAALGLGHLELRELSRRWTSGAGKAGFAHKAGVEPEELFRLFLPSQARRILEETSEELDLGEEESVPGKTIRLAGLRVHFQRRTAPGENLQGGVIRYGFHPSPFGPCILGLSDKGIYSLHFLRDDRGKEELRARLKKPEPNLTLVEDPDATGPLVSRIFPPYPVPGTALDRESHPPLDLHLLGTDFQLRIWRALLGIPSGGALTYGELARRLGIPGATQAVGGAVGSNPVPFLVPCHRILPKAGGFGNFGEGPPRKKAMLAWEFLRTAGRTGL